MTFAIAGIIAAIVSTIVALAESIRSTPLIKKSSLTWRNLISKLDWHTKEQQELFQHLQDARLEEPLTIAKLQNAVASGLSLREEIKNSGLLNPLAEVEIAAKTRIQFLIAAFFAFISIACQVAALIANYA